MWAHFRMKKKRKYMSSGCLRFSCIYYVVLDFCLNSHFGWDAQVHDAVSAPRDAHVNARQPIGILLVVAHTVATIYCQTGLPYGAAVWLYTALSPVYICTYRRRVSQTFIFFFVFNHKYLLFERVYAVYSLNYAARTAGPKHMRIVKSQAICTPQAQTRKE